MVNPSAATDATGHATGSVLATTPGKKTVTVTAGATVLAPPPSVTFIADVNNIDLNKSKVAGSKVVAAVAGSVAITQTATLVFIGDAAHLSAANSTFSAAPSSGVVANGTTSSARDVNNNVVPNLLVSMSVLDSTVTNPAASSNATGSASGSIVAVHSGTKAVTAVVGNGGATISLSVNVAYIADSSKLSASLSTLASSANSLVADGSADATITVTVRDVNGNVVPGQAVALTAAGTTVSQGAVTDVNGVSTGKITATVAGTKTVSATVGAAALLIKPTATVTFTGDATHVSAANSTVTASPRSNVVADGSTSSTITVTARDVNNNVVSGVSVALATTDGTVLSPGSGTDVNGVATGSIRAIHSGSKTISATLGAGALLVTQTASVSFIGDATHLSAANSTVVAIPNSGLAANGATASAITVTVRDVNTNPVPGVSVTLATSGATATNPSAVTDVNGLANGSLTATIAGTKTVTATAGSTAIMQTASVAFIGDAAHLSASLSTLTSSASTLVANGSSAATLTAVVRDVNGNVIPGVAVTLSSAGAATVTNPSAVTDATGSAAGSIVAALAGNKVVTALAGGVTITQTATIAFIGDAAHLSVANSSAT